MRRAARTDTTHASIRDGLRACGYSVADTRSLGDGFPDLLVGAHGHTYLIECKTPRGRKTAQDRLGEAQRRFQASWKGSAVIAAYSLEEALTAIRRGLRGVAPPAPPDTLQ